MNYPHTFTAQTAGSVGFSVVGSVATPVIAGWSEKNLCRCGLLRNAAASAVLLFPPGLATSVSAAEKVCIILQEFVPLATSDGYTNTATVQASFIYSNAGPALTASYTLKDTTTLSADTLDLRKKCATSPPAAALASATWPRAVKRWSTASPTATTAPSRLPMW